VAAACVAFVLVAVIGALVADMVDPARFRLGPHRAELRLTLQRAEVIDLGPLGTLSKRSHLGPFGYEITVKEIPRGSTGSTPLSLEDYVHLYTDQSQIRANARRALVRHSLRGALAAEIIVIAGIVGLRALLGAPRRRELAALLRERRLPFAIASSVVVVVFATAWVVDVARPPPIGRASSVLRDTPLAGAAVHGELLRVLVDEYGPRVTDFVRENDRFYESVNVNLGRAYRNGVPLTASPTTETMLVTAGLHCNLGMASVIGRAVDLWDPRRVVTAGDDAIGTSAIDPSCINSFAYHVHGTPVLAAPGDHDSDAAIDAMHRHGFTVLDGKVTEQRGLVALGDADPRVAVLAGGLVPRRDETVTEMGSRLADTACDATTRVDVVVANEPGAIAETASRGCARLAIAGVESGSVFRTTASGRSVAVALAGSAGGAAPNTITVGPLQSPAELLVVELAKDTHQPLRYQRIHFFPDASVTVDPPLAVSTAPLGVVP
jgi:hypothetical protein